MTLPRRLMTDGERVVASTRTHVKVLLAPVVVLLVVAAAGGFLAAWTRDQAGASAAWAVAGVALVLVLWRSVLPFLRWLTWTYTVTNKRIVEQKGLLTRTGRVIPLSRVNDVSFEKNLNDRVLGSGTLVIHDASEQTGLRLHDVPGVDELHRTLTELIHAEGSASGHHESV
ncbi:PH domain-containing protein [Aeromicrobium massiliense]|uniref:PH domain-containing protein n=1 Tax=Aeromicrobium massiliense TaxID=1464554 RepID=UPI0002F7BABB|nr:PH domain-containing protein [Aeromicrobium massiliense]